jgi:signal transduction histidine kinase
VGDLPELPILGDRQLLTQMLNNLVENAIKYTSGDGKTVEVKTGWREASKGKLAWVQVIDNGPGIPPEHLPHLFDRFYQVDKARTRQNGENSTETEQTPLGAGLGLSIAQWIAKAHDSEIKVKSELGKGSIFEFSLPMVELKQ